MQTFWFPHLHSCFIFIYLLICPPPASVTEWFVWKCPAVSQWLVCSILHLHTPLLEVWPLTTALQPPPPNPTLCICLSVILFYKPPLFFLGRTFCFLASYLCPKRCLFKMFSLSSPHLLILPLLLLSLLLTPLILHPAYAVFLCCYPTSVICKLISAVGGGLSTV